MATSTSPLKSTDKKTYKGTSRKKRILIDADPTVTQNPSKRVKVLRVEPALKTTEERVHDVGARNSASPVLAHKSRPIRVALAPNPLRGADQRMLAVSPPHLSSGVTTSPFSIPSPLLAARNMKLATTSSAHLDQNTLATSRLLGSPFRSKTRLPLSKVPHAKPTTGRDRFLSQTQKTTRHSSIGSSKVRGRTKAEMSTSAHHRQASGTIVQRRPRVESWLKAPPSQKSPSRSNNEQSRPQRTINTVSSLNSDGMREISFFADAPQAFSTPKEKNVLQKYSSAYFGESRHGEKTVKGVPHGNVTIDQSPMALAPKPDFTMDISPSSDRETSTPIPTVLSPLVFNTRPKAQRINKARLDRLAKASDKEENDVFMQSKRRTKNLTSRPAASTRSTPSSTSASDEIPTPSTSPSRHRSFNADVLAFAPGHSGVQSEDDLNDANLVRMLSSIEIDRDVEVIDNGDITARPMQTGAHPSRNDRPASRPPGDGRVRTSMSPASRSSLAADNDATKAGGSHLGKGKGPTSSTQRNGIAPKRRHGSHDEIGGTPPTQGDIGRKKQAKTVRAKAKTVAAKLAKHYAIMDELSDDELLLVSSRKKRHVL